MDRDRPGRLTIGLSGLGRGPGLGLELALLLALALAIPMSDAMAFRMSVASVTSTGASPTTLAFGDTVTIELVVQNEAQRPILGIGLVAFGYDVDRNRRADDGLRMVGAETVASIFNPVRASDGEISGGVEACCVPREIDFARQSGSGDYLGLYTSLFEGISLTDVGTGDGHLDTGLGGRSIADGDVHFRIAFQATSLLDPAQLTLHFGSGRTSGPESYGQGVVLRENGEILLLPVDDALLTFTILADPNFVPPVGGGSDGAGGTGGAGGVTGTDTVGGDPGYPYPPVPEPGPALLLGLGLAGLGLVRARD